MVNRQTFDVIQYSARRRFLCVVRASGREPLCDDLPVEVVTLVWQSLSQTILKHHQTLMDGVGLV